MKKSIIILGSTGSIGTQTADVAMSLGYSVRAISCGKNISEAEKQIRMFRPEICAVSDEEASIKLSEAVKDTNTKIIGEEDAAIAAAEVGADVCVSAISGFAGLKPTYAALRSSPRLAIANKESIVAAGQIIKSEAKRNGCEIIPVDSEHSAIFQCLRSGDQGEIKRLILTCSGGAFFGKTSEELKNVSISETLAHPTWCMGGKITVDCATLMNKGLEVIEAMRLFDISPDKIDVIIHRESIIHSMVEYVDNAVIAQLGTADMRTPIQYALTYPKRAESKLAPLDLAAMSKLSFYKPDTVTFPSLELAYNAAKIDRSAPCIMNGANECAVSLFMNGKIRFPDIYNITKETLDTSKITDLNSMDDVFCAHENAIKRAFEISEKYVIR